MATESEFHEIFAEATRIEANGENELSQEKMESMARQAGISPELFRKAQERYRKRKEEEKINNFMNENRKRRLMSKTKTALLILFAISVVASIVYGIVKLDEHQTTKLNRITAAAKAKYGFDVGDLVMTQDGKTVGRVARFYGDRVTLSSPAFFTNGKIFCAHELWLVEKRRATRTTR